MDWYFEVDPQTGEYRYQDDDAFALRCEARENAIYEAADKLCISREALEKDDYIGRLNEDAFEDMEHAEVYLREYYGIW